MIAVSQKFLMGVIKNNKQISGGRRVMSIAGVGGVVSLGRVESEVKYSYDEYTRLSESEIVKILESGKTLKIVYPDGSEILYRMDKTARRVDIVVRNLSGEVKLPPLFLGNVGIKEQLRVVGEEGMKKLAPQMPQVKQERVEEVKKEEKKDFKRVWLKIILIIAIFLVVFFVLKRLKVL